MAAKDEFMSYTKKIPFVEGYLFHSFIFTKNPAEDLFKYAILYAENNQPLFILITEVGKKADYSGLKSEAICGKEIHFGYIPNYRGIADIRPENTASWQDEDKVITAVRIDETKLAEIIPKVIGSEQIEAMPRFSKELSALFDNGRFLPELEGWPLVTLVFWKTSVEAEDGQHWINNVRGNYLKDGDFINLELRFGCIHPVSLKGIRLEADLDDKSLGAFSIRQGKIKGDLYLYYENEQNRFSVTAHDNQENREKHAKELERLLLSGIRSIQGT